MRKVLNVNRRQFLVRTVLHEPKLAGIGQGVASRV